MKNPENTLKALGHFGEFIRKLSKAEPDYSYYAMEKVDDVIVVAAEKYAEDRGLGVLGHNGGFVTADGNGRAKTNAYIKCACADVGMDIFERGLCLPSDNKMTKEQQDRIIEVVRACFG